MFNMSLLLYKYNLMMSGIQDLVDDMRLNQLTETFSQFDSKSYFQIDVFQEFTFQFISIIIYYL